MERSDEELMAAYCRGDSDPLRELFRRYGERLFLAALRIVEDEAAARDVVQQTFLQLHRARRDFDGSRRFRPWLYTIALNLARDERRRRGRRREDAFAPGVEPPSERADQDPEATAEAHARRRAMARALSGLTEDQRQVVVLHWYEGLSFAEISDTTGVGLSAVKVRAHRAYKKLRELLAPLERESL